MKKPVIGISANVLDIERGPFKGCRRSYVNEDYVKAVVEAGGIPMIIPMTDDADIIAHQVESIDALLISGGQDIHPSEYGENIRENIKEISTERDRFDIELVERALEVDIPVLGICRGHQVLNVVAGGSLHQDLDYIENCEIAHDQFESHIPESHKINTVRNSVLNEVLGDRLRVNSFHHLAVKDVGSDFRIGAVSEDGVIEGIEHKSRDFVIGVQWHPEELSRKGDTSMKALFERFTLEAKRNRNSLRYKGVI